VRRGRVARRETDAHPGTGLKEIVAMATTPDDEREPEAQAVSPVTKPLRKRYFASLIRRYEKRTLAPGTLAYTQTQYLTRMIHRGATTVSAIITAAGPTKLTALDCANKADTFLLGSAGSVPAGRIVGASFVIATPFASVAPTITMTLGVHPSENNLWLGQPLTTLDDPAGTVLGGVAALPLVVAAPGTLRARILPAAAVYTAGALSITLYYQV
jgi:hypothetical protein